MNDEPWGSPVERYDLQPIQEAVGHYLKNDHTYSEICRTLGWWKNTGKGHKAPDTQRLARVLGMEEYRSHGRIHRGKNISYINAVRIVRAIGRDPVDFGL